MAARACFLVEPLMIDLDLRSGDPRPEQADDGLHRDNSGSNGGN